MILKTSVELRKPDQRKCSPCSGRAPQGDFLRGTEGNYPFQQGFQDHCRSPVSLGDQACQAAQSPQSPSKTGLLQKPALLERTH